AQDPLPVWHGDLYLETHRGVWTSQRETKAGDARGDEALRETETWCATAAVLTGSAYPYDELDALWKRHLVLEFHDILPGSSITRVHREAEQEHAAILAETLVLRDSALRALGAASAPREIAVASPSPVEEGAVLDNGLLRVRFDDRGRLVSLVDLRRGRELVPPGAQLGGLQLHHDVPRWFDAWNIDREAMDAAEPVAGALELGPDMVRVRYVFGGSSATVAWRLPAHEARLDAEVATEWHEDGRLLAMTWPLDLHAPHVTAGVQHGLVERPLPARTSWELARYEDWFQRYLHVAEGGFGVAVVTADAHGYGATSEPRDEGITTTLRTSLLRAPAYPDPTADRGTHVQRLSLLVGADLDAATRAGHAMRRALVPGATDEVSVQPVADVSGPGVVVDAVKLADDGSGDLVVRLHEALGARSVASLRAAVALSAYALCDLLERPDAIGWTPLDDGAHGLDLALPPFALRTVRLRISR
ncbi:MAG TPA: glycoside hydrolase family 38 C-terminal domain-containing protein, partial [Candidatus Nanopelagicales bacterium]|nr:glycoside hydrolase family 38 C-terminal domain-containing protein [Candidatus Nanopelagicales bacterium]